VVLGEWPTDGLPLDLADALDAARCRLSHAILTNAVMSEDVVAACQLLAEVSLLHELVAAQTDPAPGIGLTIAVEEWTGRGPQELLTAFPKTVCTALGFTRCMLSAVDGRE
jgi:hypothetical protein